MDVVVQIVSTKQDIQKLRIKRELTKKDEDNQDVFDRVNVVFAKQGFYSYETIYRGTKVESLRFFFGDHNRDDVVLDSSKCTYSDPRTWWGKGRLYIAKDLLSIKFSFVGFGENTVLSDFYAVFKYQDEHNVV